MRKVFVLAIMFGLMISTVMAYEPVHGDEYISGVVIDILVELGRAVIQYANIIMMGVSVVAITTVLVKRKIKGEPLWD